MQQEGNGPRIDAAEVDAAIARVLQAERDARLDVQRCALEAEAIVERAHQRAREIARRAAHRSVRVQRWSAAALKQQLDALARQQAEFDRVIVPAGWAAPLGRAIETLAAQLTGASR